MHLSAEGQTGLTVFATYFLNQSDCIPAEAKLRYITEQHSVNHSFCDSLPSTVQTRAVFNDAGKQICLNGTGWCNVLKDCVVACRTGSQGQWNCKPFSYWKGLSSWINKVTGAAAVKISTFLHYTYMKFHLCFIYNRTVPVQTMHKDVIWAVKAFWIARYKAANSFCYDQVVETREHWIANKKIKATFFSGELLV